MVQKKHEINKKTKNKKKTTFFDIFKKVLFWLAFLSFLITTFWVLIFSAVMRIETIQVFGAPEDEHKIIKIVEDNIFGKYFDLIPRNNLLTFSSSKIKEEVLSNFIMVRTIDIKRKFPTEIRHDIEKREMFVIWCSEKCWFVDERAETFREIAKQDLEDTKEIAIIADGSGKDVENGGKVADVKIIKLCSNLSKTVEEKSGINIDQKSIYIPSPMSGELRVKTVQGWEIYFSTERPITTQARILKRILKSKLVEEDLSQLEYIDLRIKGKAVYRFKNYEEREKELREIEIRGKTDEQEKRADAKKGEKKDKKKKE